MTSKIARILVGVKRVMDYSIKPRVLSNNTAVDINNVKMSMNPFCEIALEQAIRFKESGKTNEVCALSIGENKCTETLRTALAMGADKAIHVKTSLRTDQELHPLNVAKIFQAISLRYDPQLILLGKQSIDSDSGQVPSLLSSLLGWSLASYASKIDFIDEGLSIQREIDGGLNTVIVTLPSVISCDLRLCEPRYATLPNIMKARKKEIQEIEIEKVTEDQNIFESHIKVISVQEPPPRKSGVMLDSVEELVDKLSSVGAI